jgi:hypothetical protein
LLWSDRKMEETSQYASLAKIWNHIKPLHHLLVGHTKSR